MHERQQLLKGGGWGGITLTRATNREYQEVLQGLLKGPGKYWDPDDVWLNLKHFIHLMAAYTTSELDFI